MSSQLYQSAVEASQPATTFGHLRQRSRQACGPCRQRKRKCDGKLPCSTCTGYGYECEYNGTSQEESRSGDSHRTDITSTINKRTSSTAIVDNGLPKKKVVRLTGELKEEVQQSKQRIHEVVNRTTLPGSILEPTKSRYVGQHSLVAFPRWVGLNLQSAEPPRLHSFAYNTGVRKEPSFAVRFQLAEFVSWEEVKESIDIYETVIHPVFSFLEIERLRLRCHDHWHARSQGADLEAVISGVIGLSSLFSGILSEEREMRIVLHAKDILDDSATFRLSGIDQISAWILRTIYIRSTSRPHMAWLYSCITMHIVEATGLHREPGGILLTSNNGKQEHQETCEVRQRIGTVARCLNTLISYEYGRSAVDSVPIFQNHIVSRPGEYMLQLIELVQVLPLDDPSQDSLARRSELNIALERLTSTSTSHEFLTLVKTDLCFCIYRRLRLLDLGVKQEQQELIIAAGNAALPAARCVVARNHPWWNAVGTVFQFVCVLLAIDSSGSLSAIPDAMQTLETITKQLDTHLAKESLNTARVLVRALTEKKRKDINTLESLNRVAATDTVLGDDTQTNTTTTTLIGDDNMVDNDIERHRQQQEEWPGGTSFFDFTDIDCQLDWNAFFQPSSTITPYVDMKSWF